MKPKVHPNRGRAVSSFLLALSVGIGVTAAGMFVFSLEQLVEPLHELLGWQFSLMVVAVVCCAAWVFFYAKYDSLQRLVRSEARELDAEDLPARSFLVTGFSKVGFDPEDSNRKLTAIRANLHRVTPETIGQVCDDGEKWARMLGGWQQGLRVLRFLQGKGELPNVTIIDNGTGQIEEYCRLVQSAFPDIRIATVPEDALENIGQQPKRLRIDRNYQPKADYESYEYVSAAFDRAFENICTATALPRSEIESQSYVDITPGTKVFSVAAAIQTLNRGVIFLYVTSNKDSDRVAERPGGHVVLGFDADAQFRLSKG